MVGGSAALCNRVGFANRSNRRNPRKEQGTCGNQTGIDDELHHANRAKAAAGD
jgi:hypothetical protein